MRGMDHVGFTVPNLDAATRFFVDIIGCEYVYSLGPFKSGGDWMRNHLNVDPRAVMRELRFFRCGHEYEAPDQVRIPPRNSDVGGHHLAFYVDDFRAALGYLKQHNVVVLGEPTERTSGPSAGQTWVYFLSPWGMQLELLSYPRGKRYEETSFVRLWNPTDPAA